MSMRETLLPRYLAAPTLKISFGPFRMLEAVPWLMFATSMRVLAWQGLAPCLLLANGALFLAFVLAARRMVEFTNGSTELGRLTFEEQIRLTGAVIARIIPILAGGAILALVLGFREMAPNLLLGFDGIAFDQYTHAGRAWSSALAAIVLMMVLQAGRGEKVRLGAAFTAFARHARWLVPAIALVALVNVGLTHVQGAGRLAVYYYWQNPLAPMLLKKVTYFVFIFGFAWVRLWITLAILVFALRESYRRR